MCHFFIWKNNFNYYIHVLISLSLTCPAWEDATLLEQVGSIPTYFTNRFYPYGLKFLSSESKGIIPSDASIVKFSVARGSF